MNARPGRIVTFYSYKGGTGRSMALANFAWILAASGDPNAMLLAGIAAWKSDQIKLALEHWRAAQAIKPNPQLAAMIQRVENEAVNDKSGEKLIGMRIALRYEGQSLPYETAKTMLTALDSEVARIGDIVGCPSQERLIAIIQSPEAYRRGANAAPAAEPALGDGWSTTSKDAKGATK